MLVVAVAWTAVVPAAADADPFRSWSVAPSRFFQETEHASVTAVADGRAWQLSFDRQTKPVLRSRRLVDGRASAVPVRIPRPRGGQLMSEGSGWNDAQLFVVGTRGYTAGDWCVEWSMDGDECERSRGFSVQFDVRTGRVFRSSQPRESPLLVGGDRVSYVSGPDWGRMVLRDALTRRRVFTFPRGAREVQGAGPYISWKDPDAYEREFEEPGPGDVGPNWTAMHVRERATGRAVYDLRQGTIRKRVQPSATAVQDADLQADGSVSLGVDVDEARRFRPVVVDAAGRVRDVTRRPMRGPNQFWSAVAGTRVLFDVSTNGKGCGPEAGWVTTIGGRVGNALGRLPHSRGHAIAFNPQFLTPSTMLWIEEPTGPFSTSAGYRVRVGHDVAALPLSTRERPRC
ncbi:hypothetical protein [Patulibacter americanus]|uniref:hypothetical protein n=1 Tax=Patulibacter americanus TaxID=588672 RepID=UPI0003B38A96|nr:hypothetical protein [Patulibacter americanus]